VVCVSQKQADQIARLRRHRSKPTVVKNAILPPYSRQHNGEAVSRESIGIPEDAFVFGSVGRLSVEKGHRFMVSAFHELCDAAGPEAKLFLVIVGDGHEQASLEQQASQLGIRDRTYFAGFQGNCAEWMQLLDCMIQPSLTEGTPNSVLEALCLRVPVIATAVGGVPDLIADGENGLLVPSEAVHELAEAMKKMSGSSELRTRLIAGAHELTREYSPAYQRQKMIEVYEQVFLRKL
jgi:glycosyltransferase involved in cell wall biosynthesis